MHDARPISLDDAFKRGAERIVPLDAGTATAVEAVIDGLVYYGARPGTEPDSERAADAAAGAQFPRAVRRLVKLILLRTRDGAKTVSETQFAQASDAVVELTAGVGGAPEPEDGERGEGGARFTVDDAARSLSYLLEYEGLEDMDAAVRLETHGDRGWALHWKPVSSEAAHVGLLDPVYHALDRRALDEHPLIAFERAACIWWFARWSMPSPESPERALAWKIREWEWSLADRRSIATSRTVLSMACDVGFLESLGPRARRMARSAMRSRVGAFVVRDRSGSDVAIVDAATHERLTLHEHDLTREHKPGTVIVGRLYPFGEKKFLRSPGAFVFERHASPTAEQLLERAQSFVRMHFPLAVALEAAVSQATLGVPLAQPNDVPAATSEADARQQLRTLSTAMEHGGVLELQTAGHAVWLQATDEPRGWRIFGWDADLPLADNVAQLLEIAGLGKGGA